MHRSPLHGTIGDSQAPLFGFNNLPNQLRTQESVLLTIINLLQGYNEHPDGRINKARSRSVLRAEDSVPVKFGVHCPPRRWMSFLSWELSEPNILRIFMEASSARHRQ